MTDRHPGFRCRDRQRGSQLAVAEGRRDGSENIAALCASHLGTSWLQPRFIQVESGTAAFAFDDHRDPVPFSRAIPPNGCSL